MKFVGPRRADTAVVERLEVDLGDAVNIDVKRSCDVEHSVLSRPRVMGVRNRSSAACEVFGVIAESCFEFSFEGEAS